MLKYFINFQNVLARHLKSPTSRFRYRVDHFNILWLVARVVFNQSKNIKSLICDIMFLHQIGPNSPGYFNKE